MIAAVTDENFEAEVLGHAGLVLVDFHADWCGPCKAMQPVLEQIDADQEELKVASVDIDENPEVTASHSVQSIPTLLLFRDGRIVKQFIGAMPKARLEAELLPEIS